jgi:hypothetical protein
LGYDPFRASAQRRLALRISRKGGILEARMEMSDTQAGSLGFRELQSEQTDCAELAATLCLAMALAIDPAYVGARPSANASVPSPAQTSAQSSSLNEATPWPSDSGVQSWPPVNKEQPLWRLGVGMHLALGSAPGRVLGLRTELGRRVQRQSFGLELRLDLEGEVPQPGGGRVGVRLAGAAVLPCAHLGVAKLCAHAFLGWLQGRGSAGVETTPFVAAGPRVGLELPLGRGLMLTVGGDLDLVLTPTRFVLNQNEAFKTFPVVATLGGGILVQFP